jgi:DNA polymerase-3 subunit alpha/error-prone DNA polymerase
MASLRSGRYADWLNRQLDLAPGPTGWALYEPLLQNKTITKARDLNRFAGHRIRFAGWLITGKVVYTKHGEPMEFLSFEDETGIVETTFFPMVYDQFCHMIDWGRPYLLSGKVEENWGAFTLTVDMVLPLGPAF